MGAILQGTLHDTSETACMRMRSPKDHAEFAVVRKWVRRALGGLLLIRVYIGFTVNHPVCVRSPKDHAEFAVVREWVRRALGGLCEGGSVALEREKSVLKQGAVQHLYARLAGTHPHRGHSKLAVHSVWGACHGNAVPWMLYVPTLRMLHQ